MGKANEYKKLEIVVGMSHMVFLENCCKYNRTVESIKERPI